MKVLFIEGTPANDNGNLRAAFRALLDKELKGQMPTIIMGNGKTQTVNKFHTRPLEQGEERYLLVDSDTALSGDRAEYIAGVVADFNAVPGVKKQTSMPENTFLMVQEAEAWLMSQAELIDTHYKVTSFHKKWAHKSIVVINNPSDVLAEEVRNIKKSYHKVRNFSKILPLLDTGKLKTDFVDFKELIDGLKIKR